MRRRRKGSRCKPHESLLKAQRCGHWVLYLGLTASYLSKIASISWAEVKMEGCCSCFRPSLPLRGEDSGERPPLRGEDSGEGGRRDVGEAMGELSAASVVSRLI